MEEAEKRLQEEVQELLKQAAPRMKKR